MDSLILLNSNSSKILFNLLKSGLLILNSLKSIFTGTLVRIFANFFDKKPNSLLV